MPKDQLVDEYDNFDRIASVYVDPNAGILKTANSLKASILQQKRSLTVSVSEMEKYIDGIDHLPELKGKELPANSGQGPQGKKGTMDGEQFDSMWEGAVYVYYRYIKGLAIERNRTEWLPYIDDDGKKRKFYPDFKIGNRFVEVKGIYRTSDMCKMTQHPEVEFIDKTTIGPILTELTKKLPDWKKDYIVI